MFHDEAIFRVTSPLWLESTGYWWISLKRSATQSFYVFFDLRRNKRLSKQSRSRWFETPWRSLWRHCNASTCPFPRAGTVLNTHSQCYGNFFGYLRFRIRICLAHHIIQYGRQDLSKYRGTWGVYLTSLLWGKVHRSPVGFPRKGQLINYRQTSNISHALVGNKIVITQI